MSARILLVEDEPSLRMAIEDALTGHGFDVVAVADGAEGEHDRMGGRHRNQASDEAATARERRDRGRRRDHGRYHRAAMAAGARRRGARG